MTTQTIQVTSNPEPEFLDYRGVERMFSIRRGHLYLLDKEGAIKSVSFRKVGAVKGRRLYNVASIRAYLSKLSEGAE
jgi:hypothetical protein